MINLILFFLYFFIIRDVSVVSNNLLGLSKISIYNFKINLPHDVYIPNYKIFDIFYDFKYNKIKYKEYKIYD